MDGILFVFEFGFTFFRLNLCVRFLAKVQSIAVAIVANRVANIPIIKYIQELYGFIFHKNSIQQFSIKMLIRQHSIDGVERNMHTGMLDGSMNKQSF